jgi:hypothetical protein
MMADWQHLDPSAFLFFTGGCAELGLIKIEQFLVVLISLDIEQVNEIHLAVEQRASLHANQAKAWSKAAVANVQINGSKQRRERESEFLLHIRDHFLCRARIADARALRPATGVATCQIVRTFAEALQKIVKAWHRCPPLYGSISSESKLERTCSCVGTAL